MHIYEYAQSTPGTIFKKLVTLAVSGGGGGTGSCRVAVGDFSWGALWYLLKSEP